MDVWEFNYRLCNHAMKQFTYINSIDYMTSRGLWGQSPQTGSCQEALKGHVLYTHSLGIELSRHGIGVTDAVQVRG